MKRLDLKLGYECNNNCMFCILGDKRKWTTPVPTSQILHEIKAAKCNSVKKLVITGGEPAIRYDIMQIIAFAGRLGFKTILLESNGRMLSYQNFLDGLIKAGVNAFSITLPVHEPKLYSELCQTRESGFKQMLTGITNIVQHPGFDDITLSINSPITKYNHADLDKIIRLAHKLGVKHVNFPFVNPKGSALEYKDKVVISLSEAERYLHGAIKLAHDFGLSVTTEMIPFCFMQGFESSVSEQYQKNMSISAPDYKDKDFEESRAASRVKGSICKECSKNHICEGITPGYAKIYGFSELKPIK